MREFYIAKGNMSLNLKATDHSTDKIMFRLQYLYQEEQVMKLGKT